MHPFKKNIIIFGCFLLLGGCSIFFQKLQPYILGNKHASTSWIYLSGLIESIDSEKELHHREILDALGKELNIRIIAVPSKFRCTYFDNKLCWPHETPESLETTFGYILAYADTPIEGYIGFSNGGFFLHNVIQHYAINQPIITIGASGALNKDSVIHAKSVTIIIGKKDSFHYKYAIHFAHQLKKRDIQVNLIEHDEGHIMPKDLIKETLQRLIKQQEV